MKKDAETARGSPLAGTERTFFEGRRESLRAGYEADVQALVNAWEASAAAVASLRLKRTGQFWTTGGFAALLRIVVRYWNGELDSLWPASAA